MTKSQEAGIGRNLPTSLTAIAGMQVCKDNESHINDVDCLMPDTWVDDCGLGTCQKCPSLVVEPCVDEKLIGYVEWARTDKTGMP